MFKDYSLHSSVAKKYWLIANISTCLLIIFFLLPSEFVFAKSPDYQVCEPDNASCRYGSEMDVEVNDSNYLLNSLLFYATEDTPEPTFTSVASNTPTYTPSFTVTNTSTYTPSVAATSTSTYTPSFTVTNTSTYTPSVTVTFTRTYTPSNTSTFTSTPTFTDTPDSTDTSVPTLENTITRTFTKQPDHAEDESATPAPNNWVVYPVKSTITPTEIATQTISSTAVSTSTETPTNTPVPSDTAPSTQTSTAAVVEKLADEPDSHLPIWIISSIGFVLLVIAGSIVYWRRK